MKDYQLERLQSFMRPLCRRGREGIPRRPGPPHARARRPHSAAGSGQSAAGGLVLPNAHNDYIFAVIGQELGFLGATRGDRPLLPAGLPRLPGRGRGSGHLRRAPRRRHHRVAVLQAFVNIGVVVTLLPVTGITLPFVSAGGSSLIVSLVAAGILLSVSRETAVSGGWAHASGWSRPAERAGTSTRLSPSLDPCARARWRLSWPGSAGGAAWRPSWSRRPGSRSGCCGCARCGQSGATSISSSTRCASPPRCPRHLGLLRRRPAAVFTTGGYVAIPVLVAACDPAHPVVLWDGNVVPGRSVRATARLAGAIAVTDPRTAGLAARPLLPDRDARSGIRAPSTVRLPARSWASAPAIGPPGVRRIPGGAALQRCRDRGAARPRRALRRPPRDGRRRLRGGARRPRRPAGGAAGPLPAVCRSSPRT